MFGTDQLEPREAEWLWTTMGVVPTSADPGRTDAAIATAGLQVDKCIEVGTEWGEWAEEQTGKGSRQLLHASRLLRAPERPLARVWDDRQAKPTDLPPVSSVSIV
jgi:hypothetical protein